MFVVETNNNAKVNKNNQSAKFMLEKETSIQQIYTIVLFTDK